MTTTDGNYKFSSSISLTIAVFLLFSIEFMFRVFPLSAPEISTTDGKFGTEMLLRIGLNVCISF